MSSFPVHSRETAPEAAYPTLDAVTGLFGFIPNLLGVMATSPALAEAYVALSGIFEKSGLNAAERQVVLLMVSRFHECHYCMAAHSLAADMEQVPTDVVEAIRSDHPITDPKLEALRVYVNRLIEKRGWIDETEMAEFLAAGFEPSHALDVLVGVGQKTLSNFTNHLAKTPLDSAFDQHAWAPAE
ncbi:MAG: carboxymuconolactone decarboxylase family protein [gamma proteobacterium endosymbiont of Lamellibrachia anaximandri]|nr:carboxymuconolactone decarboxylase family protein [gamma proteobacterium endosymbiont of Lamellibrachia anaximandri]MBL3535012.1 carboxymuconolactone decarboxylase family protein [gamma proteobacterium endosymbiont of Lamellibrachia anaximandri]